MRVDSSMKRGTPSARAASSRTISPGSFESPQAPITIAREDSGDRPPSSIRWAAKVGFHSCADSERSVAITSSGRRPASATSRLRNSRDDGSIQWMSSTIRQTGVCSVSCLIQLVSAFSVSCRRLSAGSWSFG